MTTVKSAGLFWLLLGSAWMAQTNLGWAASAAAKPPVIVSATIEKCTHLAGGSEGPAHLSVLTDPPGAKLHFSGPGKFQSTSTGETWIPTKQTPLGKSGLKVIAHTKDGTSKAMTIAVYLTKQRILTTIGNQGRYIEVTGLPSVSQPSPPYKPLSAYVGRDHVVMYELWGIWNSWSKLELPRINALVEKYKSAGFLFLGDDDSVGSDNVESAEAIKEFFAASRYLDFDSLIGVDPAWVKYNQQDKGQDYPTSILIDRDGNIRLKMVGALEGAELQLWADTIAELTGDGGGPDGN